MSTTTNSKPVDRIRLGRVSAAIWRHLAEDGSPFYKFTIDTSYKDSAGNYQSTNSFGLRDALLVAKIANLVDTRIRKLQEVEQSTSRINENHEEEL